MSAKPVAMGAEEPDPERDGGRKGPPPGGETPSMLWLRAIQDGSATTAWYNLHAQYGAELVDYARTQLGKHMKSRMDPEDLCQRAFMRAIPRFFRLPHNRPKAFLKLLRATIRWAAMDEGRLKGIQKESPAANLGSEVMRHADRGRVRSPQSLAAIAEEMELVKRAVDRLPRLYREIVIAVDIEGRDRKDVAAERKVSTETLRRQHNRGRSLLRERLSGGR